MAERRKSGRSRVLKSAKLVLGRSAIIDSVVRNLTNKGARLQIANTVDLPRDFEMTLDGGYSIRPCRLVWR
ncbi:MAG: PilZ domain-containing protein, partial [Pseudolabrys sp.]